MRIRGILYGITVALVILGITLALSTCGGERKQPSAISLQSSDRSGGFQTADDPASQSLDDALAELDALPTPEGVDAALFAELKDALREALAERASSVGAIHELPSGDKAGRGDPALQDGPNGVYKFVSTPPTGDANRVDDLELVDNLDGTFTLTWTYKNVGDYDQNGTVGISDITPIAMHFGETYAPTDVNCLLAVIDGSGDGKIDIADITPIAINFGTVCAGYSIRGASSYPNNLDETSEIGTAVIAGATGEGRKRFSVALPESEYQFFAVAPYDGASELGELSNVVPLPDQPPVAVLTVDPTTGEAPLEVTFDASASTDPDGEIIGYEWDFDGDGEYDDGTTEPANVYTYESPGIYESALRVTDDDGAQATDSVTITVNKSSGEWHIVLVDSVGDVGEYTSLALVNGNPAISYYDDTNENLNYVRASDADGSSWGSPLTLDSAGDVGSYTSLFVVNSNPAISYWDYTNYDLKYVRANDANGSVWGSPKTVDSAGNGETSLAIVNGNPAISYFGGDDLKYARATDADGTSWGSRITVDNAGNVGWDTSLAIVNGNPAISYYDKNNRDLKYVRASDADGESWGTPVIVDSEGDVGADTSLQVVNGYPAISYGDAGNYDLKYVRAVDANGESWGTPVIVDSEGVTGMCTSLQVVKGNPAISYYDYTNCDLKYVPASDADGATWGAPLTLDSEGSVGSYTFLQVVNGNPAISYYDWTNGNLKFTIYH